MLSVYTMLYLQMTCERVSARRHTLNACAQIAKRVSLIGSRTQWKRSTRPSVVIRRFRERYLARCVLDVEKKIIPDVFVARIVSCRAAKCDEKRWYV